MIIRKIVQIHVNEDVYYNGKIDPKALGAVSRLAGHYYAKIGEIFLIGRPE